MSRTTIPGPIKRAVRQRCGFGCVACGNQIYEYDHITPEARGGETVPANLTLLCGNHHADKTRGLISERQVKEWDSNPMALRAGVSPHNVMTGSTNFGMDLAGNVLVANGRRPVSLLCIDGRRYFTLRRRHDGTIGLDAEFHNDRGDCVLGISDSELVLGDAQSWDIEWRGNQITIRSAPRALEFVAKFDSEAVLKVERARILVQGFELRAGPATQILPGALPPKVMNASTRLLAFGFGRADPSDSTYTRVSMVQTALNLREGDVFFGAGWVPETVSGIWRLTPNSTNFHLREK